MRVSLGRCGSSVKAPSKLEALSSNSNTARGRRERERERERDRENENYCIYVSFQGESTICALRITISVCTILSAGISNRASIYCGRAKKEGL
jgi:hypothetical protein